MVDLLNHIKLSNELFMGTLIHALFEYNELQKCNSFMQQAELELFTAFNSSTLNSEHHQHAVETFKC